MKNIKDTRDKILYFTPTEQHLESFLEERIKDLLYEYKEKKYNQNDLDGMYEVLNLDAIIEDYFIDIKLTKKERFIWEIMKII